MKASHFYLYSLFQGTITCTETASWTSGLKHLHGRGAGRAEAIQRRYLVKSITSINVSSLFPSKLSVIRLRFIFTRGINYSCF